MPLEQERKVTGRVLVVMVVVVCGGLEGGGEWGVLPIICTLIQKHLDRTD